MKIIEFIEISKEDIQKSRELAKELDSLVLSEIPKYRVKVAALKEEVWVAAEALRKSQYLQLDDSKEREQALRALNNQLEIGKRELQTKADAIYSQIESINKSYLPLVVELVEQEFKRLNDPDVVIFRTSDKFAKEYNVAESNEKTVKFVVVETNENTLVKKREILQQLLNKLRAEFSRLPLHICLAELKEVEATYNRLNIKTTEKIELTQRQFREAISRRD